MKEYQTIKILASTHPRLKILAAQTGESIIELIDRLVREEDARRKEAGK